MEQALTACAQPLRLVAVGVPSGQNEGKLLVATACLPAAVRAMRTRLAAVRGHAARLAPGQSVPRVLLLPRLPAWCGHSLAIRCASAPAAC